MPWHSGILLVRPAVCFASGGAAGESQPLIGEKRNMALQSAKLLESELIQQPAAAMDALRAMLLQRCYAQVWNQLIAPRLRHSAIRAHRDALAATQAGQRITLRLAPTPVGGRALFRQSSRLNWSTLK